MHLRVSKNLELDGVIVVKATISVEGEGTFWFTATIIVKDNSGTGHFFIGRGTGTFEGQRVNGIISAPLGGGPTTLTGTWFRH